ncbi:11089_t:CDS:2, partial [Dentiscutata heterogama]
KCELEDLGDKISIYIKSLANTNKEQRGSKAKELLARYREPREQSTKLVLGRRQSQGLSYAQGRSGEIEIESDLQNKEYY